ncbi:Cytochrome c-552 [bacterium HR21]|nr:Cytochrome c-552 [bacterium HR21]
MRLYRILVEVLFLGVFALACGGSEEKPANSEKASQPSVAQSEAVPTVAGVAPQTMQRGKQIYDSYCKTCHQANGQGIPGVYPPLAKSDYLQDKRKVIHALVFGLSGPITVNGKKFNGVMPPAPYNDQDLAAVLTYVYNSFGNPGGIVTPEEVAAVRKAGK